MLFFWSDFVGFVCFMPSGMHKPILYIQYRVLWLLAGEKLGINVDTIKKQVQDEDCKKLLTHCKEPRAFNEMKGAKIKESKLFKLLKELKLSEALLFADGKYYTSPDVFEFLD